VFLEEIAEFSRSNLGVEASGDPEEMKWIIRGDGAFLGT
jgi:hypothetical protein